MPTRGSGALVPALLLLALSAAGLQAQSWRTVTMSRQLEGEDAVHVEVQYGAGTFTVRPGEPGSLYRMELQYDEELFEPVSEYRDDRLTVGVEGVGRRMNIGKGDRAGRLDLELGRDVPLHLALRFGAVRADLDLGGLALLDLELTTGASDSKVRVSELNPVRMGRASFEVGAASFVFEELGNLNADLVEIDAGVGDLTLDLSGDWQRAGKVAVDLGLGSLNLRIPRGLGVHLVRDTFLTTLDAPEMVKRGDEYFSADWDRAERRVTIEVEAAFGRIGVHWIQ